MEDLSTPLVSILTITYNRADLIHKCIESIQKQTYRNYEHIIVDGDSPDNTEEIVRGFNDPHIKYIKLEVRGPEVQMAAAFEASRGKYITFLDDDDEYLQEKVEKQVSFFETLSDKYGMIYCWMTYFDINDPNIPIQIHKPEYRGDLSVKSASENKISGTPTLMVKRNVIMVVGGIFKDKIVGLLMSDIEFATRVCQKYLVDYIPESLVKVYVNHSHGRLSSNYNIDKIKKMIVFHEYFLSEFSNIFEKDFRLGKLHYDVLTRCYFKVHNYKKGFHYYFKLLKCTPSLTQVLKPIAGIILNK